MSASRSGELPDGGAGASWPGPAGWFGKLRALGDFASRRLPPEFIEPWDEWLSEELFAARQALGEDWAEAWANAPTWRFALTAGVLGSGPWFGVLMPSVDRVGRQYPLTFAARFPVSTEDGNAEHGNDEDRRAEALGRWWSGLIGIAAQLNREPPWDLPTLEAALHAQPGGAAGDRAVLQQFAPALAAAADGTSLWWPRGDGAESDGPVTTLGGLPRAEQFVRLIRPGA